MDDKTFEITTVPGNNIREEKIYLRVSRRLAMTNEYHRPRPDMKTVAPQVFEQMQKLSRLAKDNGIDETLQELIKVRVSQINGCAYCLAMHIGEARRLGIPDDKLHMLTVWKDAPGFPEPERVALELAEAVTKIADGSGVSNELYDELRQHYTDEQYVSLLTAINVINAWNRFMIALDVSPKPHANDPASA
jgi:AhpD family alkylhydroperoxidase